MTLDIRRAFNFVSSDWDDACSDALLLAVSKIDNFDPTRDAFRYFSSIIFNFYRRDIALRLKRQAKYESNSQCPANER